MPRSKLVASTDAFWLIGRKFFPQNVTNYWLPCLSTFVLTRCHAINCSELWGNYFDSFLYFASLSSTTRNILTPTQSLLIILFMTWWNSSLNTRWWLMQRSKWQEIPFLQHLLLWVLENYHKMFSHTQGLPGLIHQFFQHF